MIRKLNWNALAIENGQANSKEMLEKLYLRFNMSLRGIAILLGVSHQAVKVELLKQGIKLRKRGGPNFAKRN